MEIQLTGTTGVVSKAPKTYVFSCYLYYLFYEKKASAKAWKQRYNFFYTQTKTIINKAKLINDFVWISLDL